MEFLLELVLLILLCVFCFWLSIIIHELGHLITGLLHGWKFMLLVVGPIGLKKEDHKLKLYLEKKLAMWGGVGGTLPSAEQADNIRIWSNVLLAGPVVSIVTGIIFLSLNFIYFSIIFLLLGLISITIGIICLLPFETGITYTDGKRWSRLHNGGQGQAEEISLWNMIMAQVFNRDMLAIKLDDFAPLLTAKLPAIRYYGYYYLYQYYSIRNDEKNKQEALEVLNEMKINVPQIIVDDCKI